MNEQRPGEASSDEPVVSEQSEVAASKARADDRPRRCFVISPIGAEDSEIREHADDVFSFIIEPAMRECGVEVVRSDHLMEPGRISEQMFRELFGDDLCIALVTGRNPNVFYELALAQASGRPVIVLLSRDEQLPFDIQDLRSVRYDLKPRPLFDGVYAREVVEHVRGLERSGWRVDPPFATLGFGGPCDDTLTFLEHAAKHVPPDQWAGMLTESREVFDLMGVSLHSWKRTDGVKGLFGKQAADGCAIRVLLMDRDNPALTHLFSGDLGDRTLDTVVRDIDLSREFFSEVVQACPDVKLRMIRRGVPYCQFTRTDDWGLFIPYMNSRPTAYSPVWKCSSESTVYGALVQEFEALWKANAV
jgi:hypothetical protein